MSLTLKIFYQDEIRRINVDPSCASSFEYLSGKVKTAFGDALDKKVVFKWRDSEGDLVTFSSDDELLDALSSADNGVLKIFVEKSIPKAVKKGAPFCASSPFDIRGLFVDVDGHSVHHGITCDGCEMTPLRGDRFKCKVCPDYDLCRQCKDNQVHPCHEMEEIPNARMPHFMHPRFGRGGCHGKKRQQREDKESFEKVFSAEEKKDLKEIVEKITEAAKNEASIAGTAASACAAKTVGVAIRSTVKRAVIVKKTTGFEGKHPEKDHSESSSSSDSEDEKTQLFTVKFANKQQKKLAKCAPKKIAKMTFKEVEPKFGRMAAKWAAKAARQSMALSMRHAPRVEETEDKREETDEMREQRTDQESAGTSKPIAPAVEGVYPKLPEAATEEQVAINKAIQVFCDMGYKPDDWLVACIREANGSIPEVFEKLKPSHN